ncbi:GNAT family N-acetyltransferase [Miniphocaeibacter massiliensis]|uniref:GNAT family N-acetyltransferase n=1 Tax=Miniphocaeibacter massiliensis TaxID=2041841 RepID=UPI000C088FF8|nr:GNAT family N-acetyltransferase [Miniphocaeibacter massiliensis]
MKESIINCEISFRKCFSKYLGTNSIVRFRDYELPKMYDHNMTLIKTKNIDKEELKEIIKEEVKISYKDGLSFTKILIDKLIEEDTLKTILEYKEITYYGFYELLNNEYSNWKINEISNVIVANNKKHIDDLCELEISEYGEVCGKEFCEKSIRLRSKVFLEPGNSKMYLIYMGNELVGKCQLFIKNKTAKIENFDVKESFRNKRIGTSLLKEIVKKAVDSRVNEIYLVTDESDRVKDMYKKLRFEQNYFLIIILNKKGI